MPIRRLPLVLLLVLLAPQPALAIKWRECPQPPTAVYPSTIGAVSSPFVHPGHALRVVLNSVEAASGGFSLEPDGNDVEITFASLFGDPVALAPRRATAVSATVLDLVFPDAEAELGRVLAGPVEMRIRVGDRLVAWITPDDLVGLPPSTDVTGLLLDQGPPKEVAAALGASGDVWIPVRFQGEPMAMPGCPGNYIQPVKVAVGAASLRAPLPGRRDPLGRIRTASLFLGDVVINDTSFYGMLFTKRLPLMHVAGTSGVSICKLNDSMDLVLRVKGSRSWSRSKRSPMAELVAGAQPLLLVLRSAEQVAGRVAWRERATDSFGNACSTTPDHAANDGVPAAPAR